MKATLKPTIKKFNPVTIELTFESQEELNAIGALFNSSVLSQILTKTHNIGTGDLWKVFEAAGGFIDTLKLNDYLKTE